MTEHLHDLTESEGLEGRYTNYFEVGHNAFEFVLAFGQFYPESEEPRLHTRLITGPTYAKVLAETILESLCRYEQVFGAIPKVGADGPRE
jgi:hypothetical protein